MSTAVHEATVPASTSNPRPRLRPVGKPLQDRPLRILLPSYRSHSHTGGQGVYMFYISRALADLGHEVDVISGPPYPELDPRINLIKLPSLDLYTKPKFWGGFPVFPWREVRRPIDLYEYLAHISGDFPEPYTFGERLANYMRGRTDQYDVVHDNQTLCWGLLKIGRMGMPIVGTIHHPITMDRRIAVDAADTLTLKLLTMRWYSFLRMQKKVARALDPLIVVSESTRRDVVKDFKLNADKTVLVYHGCDADVFQAQPGIQREDDLIVTTASADVPLKGLIYLIEAYAELLTAFPNLKLTVIGKLREGPTKKRLEQLGILGRVQFVSNLTRTQIAEYYSRATVAVTPSVYEGFGFPASEAMACEAPVVSTTGGSLPEVVGDAGLLAPPKNPKALAEAIATLLNDPGRRAHLSKAGRARIIDKFLWDRTAKNVVNVYSGLIENANR